MKKLRTTTTRSINMPSTKKGMVNFVGMEARLETTTSTNEHMVAMIKPKTGPFDNTIAIVNGKNSAVIDITITPTQPI